MASRGRGWGRGWEAVHLGWLTISRGSGRAPAGDSVQMLGKVVGSAGHCGADAAALGTAAGCQKVTSPRQPARTPVSPAVAPPAEKHPQDPSGSRPSQLGRSPQS